MSPFQFKQETLLNGQIVKSGQMSLHCHFLPDFEDSLAGVDYSMRFLREIYRLGWNKVVATPAVMQDFYVPKPEGIVQKIQGLERLLRQEKLQLVLEPAAEYYWDEGFLSLLESGQELLSFSKADAQNKFVLIETSLIYHPHNFAHVMNCLKRLGYSPVLSHAEEYLFLQKMPERVSILRESGVHFQINLRSLTQIASPAARRLAEWIIREKLADFWAAPPHLNLIEQAMRSPLFSLL